MLIIVMKISGGTLILNLHYMWRRKLAWATLIVFFRNSMWVIIFIFLFLSYN